MATETSMDVSLWEKLGDSLNSFSEGVAGFLGDQYNPFVLPGDASSPGFTVRDVSLTGGVDRARFERRMKVLDAVDTWQARMESSPCEVGSCTT